MTGAQSAAHLLAQRLPGGSAVLVVGTDALAAEVAAVGLRPVRLFAEDPSRLSRAYQSPSAGRNWRKQRLLSGPGHSG